MAILLPSVNPGSIDVASWLRYDACMKNHASPHAPIQVQPIDYVCPLDMFDHLKNAPGALLLNSALHHRDYGRYSYIAIEPFRTIRIKNETTEDVQGLLRSVLTQYAQPHLPMLPPFQGGLAGAIAYESHQYVEDVGIHTHDDLGLPDLMLGLYDTVISFDHLDKKAWVISTGWPEQDPMLREQRAKQRLAALCARLPHALEKRIGMPQYTVAPFRSHFTRETYEAAVGMVIDYILAGDIFEANVSQRFEAALPDNFSPWDYFLQLSEHNPAPFSAWMKIDDTWIVSASPERFVKVSQGQVEVRPIKGTCRRGSTAEQDHALAAGLAQSEKDRAENIMIVDLLRNDLSKVCDDASVDVTQLCGVETYATVHHLVSVVTGELKNNADLIDVLWALFPGGSITGAPKIRAMQIIAEIEKRNRGIYCGSLGFMGFNGEMDLSIAIRTAVIQHNTLYVQAGGAVVADSDPSAEYDETMTKTTALRQLVVPEGVHDRID